MVNQISHSKPNIVLTVPMVNIFQSNKNIKVKAHCGMND